MIKHIVMWKLEEFAEGADKKENALRVKRLLEGLKDKIKEIRFIEIGININDTPAAYDIVLYSEFNSLEDLDAYQNHPEHLIAGEFIGKVRKDRRVVDYEVP
jgi:tRNA(His) 5'-end guanylyltransferase